MSAGQHQCTGTPQVYAMQDVTVWVRVFPDGRVGSVRDSKAQVNEEAREQVAKGSDLICATCGWMGQLR